MPLFTHPKFREDIRGTLTADGSEQTIRELTRQVQEVSAYIDVTNMAADDITVVRTYLKVKSGGSYINFAIKTLGGNQSPDLLHVIAAPSTQYGFKLTLQQTAGTNRDYDYMVFTYE
jgi:hypothetical protein